MLSPETTTGALGLLNWVVGSMYSPSPVPDLEPSAVRGILTPETTRIVTNKRKVVVVAAVTLGLFLLLLLLRLCITSLQSAITMNKRIPLLASEEEVKNKKE